jgi:hypothetical protein
MLGHSFLVRASASFFAFALGFAVPVAWADDEPHAGELEAIGEKSNRLYRDSIESLPAEGPADDDHPSAILSSIIDGSHEHFDTRYILTFSNKHNAPNPPADIDVTRGPHCGCDKNFEELCANAKSKLDEVSNRKFDPLEYVAIKAFCRNNNIVPCPITVGEFYGAKEFDCKKENEKENPGTCA